MVKIGNYFTVKSLVDELELLKTGPNRELSIGEFYCAHTYL